MGLLDYFTMSPATQGRVTGLLTQLQDWQSPDNPMRQAREGQRRRAMEDEELAWQRTQRGRQQSQWDTQSKDEALIKRLMGQRTMMGPTSATEMGPPEGVPTGGMVDPGMFVNQGGSVGGLNAVQGVNAMMAPPKRKLASVGPGSSLVDEDTGKAVFTADFKPPEPAQPTAGIQEYLYSVSKDGYTGTFKEWKLEQQRAGASRVEVNTGQKGYENESKLRNDFKSEPIYKDYADMKSAYAQIQAGIKQGTPIADTAVATKIMKLLDPGSVVRESELGIAMAAAGKMDRLRNFVHMQMSGEKLTPQQRIDFGNLATELMRAAEQTYNMKRNEYGKMGERYGLDINVLGAPSALDFGGASGLPPKSAIEAEIARRKKGGK
jgi:hypothetical protein